MDSHPLSPPGEQALRRARGREGNHRRAGTPLVFEPSPKPLADGHAWHARDLARGLDDRPGGTFDAWDLAVGEQVLQRLGPAEAGRPHAVALTPRAHQRRVAEGDGVEQIVAVRRWPSHLAELRLDPP